MSHVFLSDDQLAHAAEEYVRRAYAPCHGIEKLNLMLRYIEKTYYHIISQGINEACRTLAMRGGIDGS